MSSAANAVQNAHTGHLARVFAQMPIEIARGEGVWLHSRDGRKLLDFYGGHASDSLFAREEALRNNVAETFCETVANGLLLGQGEYSDNPFHRF